MAAMRMPKGTPEQQAARDAALEAGYQAAARVPLQTAQACLDALRLSLVVAQAGNVNSASDAGVAALMARAGVEGALLNVLINLGSVKDASFRGECVKRSENLGLEATSLCEQTIAKVKASFTKA
jgi:formiminotetrahydrofolate cyclodeaminase